MNRDGDDEWLYHFTVVGGRARTVAVTKSFSLTSALFPLKHIMHDYEIIVQIFFRFILGLFSDEQSSRIILF